MIKENNLTEFSPIKQKCILLLAEGQSYSEVCRTQGIARQTLWRWRQDESFLEAVENQRDILLQKMTSDFLDLSNDANELLQEKLNLGDQEAIKIGLSVLSAFLLGKNYKQHQKAINQIFG